MMNQEQSMIAIPLQKGKKNAVQWGCVCIMLSVAMYGLVFATLTAPILREINAMEFVSLFSILAALGVSVMTPIGGKLGDIIGRRNIVIIPGIVCAIAGVVIAFVRSLWPLMVLRLIVSLAQGAFTAAPYIIVGLINEKKDVPKAMGMLATAIAVGGFGGSILAGILTDMGLMTFAILIPVVPLLAGVVLIGINLPNIKKEGKVTLDIAGVIALTVTLCGILLALNFGSTLGWTNLAVIAGFVIGIIGVYALIRVEGKATDPLIPLKLFKNNRYTAIILVGFLGYFYQNAMNVYAPIGAMQVMNASTATAGALQMPRTIITIFLPTIAGVWVAKRANRRWIAFALGTLLAAVPMIMMGFTTPEYPILIYFVALAITGIAESFRSVSIIPAAQATLEPQDIGIGTALINFSSSLAGAVSAAVLGAVYNINTVADSTSITNIQAGINAVFWIAGIVSLVGFLLVIFLIRPQMGVKEEA